MKIPIHIVEQGGEMLELYIKIAKELEDLIIKRIAMEEKIKLNMMNLNNNLKDYLPERDRDRIYYYQDGTPKPLESFEDRWIIPNIEKNSNKVNLDYLSAIESLKSTNILILERKEASFKIGKIKDKLILIERGEYRDWLHGDD
jgi:hypothetical protein